MHVLPRVREIHERFADVLTVVGVHSGKFRAERQTPRIAAAMRRLHVTHPVVNDRQVRIWRAYGVSAWPTIALIGPDGALLGTQAGEFDVESLAATLDRHVEEYDAAGVLRHGPEPVDAVELEEPSGALAFPTRALLAEDRLYVSDPGRYRLLEATLRREGGRLAARVRRSWGGAAGLSDGGPGECRFGEPEALALRGDSLYVADRSNHAIRRVRLDTGEVTTVAGTGALADSRIAEGPAGTPLRSPWGLMSSAEGLLVTMAGSHQIFELVSPESAAPSLRLIAGTGAEDIRDGPAPAAELAQPTAIAPAPASAVIADCESSAIRELAGGSVRTLVGTGLFAFGDRDGSPSEALLQHAEDVAWHDGAVFVADTYNDKVRRIDPATFVTSTVAGGEEGALSGPRGLLSLGGSLLVADTDGHRLVEVTSSGDLFEVGVDA